MGYFTYSGNKTRGFLPNNSPHWLESVDKEKSFFVFLREDFPLKGDQNSSFVCSKKEKETIVTRPAIKQTYVGDVVDIGLLERQLRLKEPSFSSFARKEKERLSNERLSAPRDAVRFSGRRANELTQRTK